MQTRDEKQSRLEEEPQVWEEEQKNFTSDHETPIPPKIESISYEYVEKKSVDSDAPPKTETECEEKSSLLDWLNFGATLLTSLATLAISYGLYVLNQQQYRTAEAKQKHEIVSGYLVQMAQLQLDKEFQNLPDDEEAKQIASAATLNTLRQLDGESDGESKGQLLKFLYRANLIGGDCKTNLETLESVCQSTVLDLGDAKLDKTMFRPPMPQLPGINLVRASLTGAELSGVDLTEATMTGVNLNDAILTRALLKQSEIDQATLENTNLDGAFLIEANLEGSSLRNANLEGADLRDAVLLGAGLVAANLHSADLSNANLQKVDLRDADLTGASLEGTNFTEAVYNDNTFFPKGFNRDEHGMELCTTPIEQECESLK